MAKIYRHICCLRARGLRHEAEHLRKTDYAMAVAAATEASGDNSEALLQTVQSAEESRVSEVVTLAELLAPMLANELRDLLGASPPLRPSTERPRRASAPPDPSSIADFIDGMLEQERAPATSLGSETQT